MVAFQGRRKALKQKGVAFAATDEYTAVEPMSTKRQASGEDYPEAAIKHCDDARHLLSASRPDGAAYLAGYAVECALKTLVQVEEQTVRLIRDHDLNLLSGEALRWAAQPTSRTARYLTNRAVTTLRYGLPPNGWKESLRYYPTGTIAAATAEQWVEEAERLYIEIVGELKKNGEI
jgi:HEPN domain-containing protein